MFKQCLFVLIMIIGVTSLLTILTGQCTCPTLTTEYDCSRANCVWNDSTAFCSANIRDCTQYTTELTCNSVTGCALNNQGLCTEFTQCTDYSVTQKNDCYYKDQICIPGSLNTTTNNYTCADGGVDCTLVITQNVCNSGLITPYGELCFWDQTCIPQNDTYCENMTSSTFCTSSGCDWDGTNCYSQNCQNFPISNCYYAVQGAAIINLCVVENEECIDANDTSFLTLESCYSQTLAGYTWVDESCQSCTPVSYSNIYQILFYLINIIFL